MSGPPRTGASHRTPTTTLMSDDHVTRHELQDALSNVTLGLTEYMDERFGRIEASQRRIEAALARIERDLRPGHNGDTA